MLRVLDLFSGIGGFSLGLERTGGFETVAFCEIDPFCRRVLAKHWPGVKCYDDVRTLTADALARDGITIDVICGGFPCQDVSEAGSRAGLKGARSGLWSEYARLVGELRPGFAIVENVTGLLSLGMGRVCGDLAALGFDCFWDTISAAAIGAPHRRDRVWIVAHPNIGRVHSLHADAGDGGAVSPEELERQFHRSVCGESALADTDSIGIDCGFPSGDVAREIAPDCQQQRGRWASADWRHSGWSSEPAVARVVDGLPVELVEPRLKALGNAVVPQIPELIGRALLAAIAQERAA